MSLSPDDINRIEESLILPFNEFMAQYVYPALEALEQDGELAQWQRREQGR